MTRLLIVSSRYPHAHDNMSSVFVKGQVDAIRHFFDEVMVVAATPYLPGPVGSLLGHRRRRDSLARDYRYGNVSVRYTKDIVLPLAFSKRRRGDGALAKTRRILSDAAFRPDLIHAHFIWPSGYVAARLKSELGAPVIITTHGFDSYRLPGEGDFFRGRVVESLASADRVIAVSGMLKDVLVKDLGVADSKIEVIPNGVDLSRFCVMDKTEARRRLGLPTDRPIVLSVGRFMPIKGHRTLIDAAARVIKKRPDVFFILIGDGPLERDMRRKIQEYGAGDSIILAGQKRHEDIPIWMGACDLYVQPSENEAFGIALIEAMACGRPIVATSVGGMPEVVCSERIGKLVRKSSSGEMADAILERLVRRHDAGLIASCARQYGWPKVAGMLADVYGRYVDLKILT